LSATTLQDWLFLLFGFLCVILLLLIILKFYKIFRQRIRNSVVVRNVRVKRISRIPIIKYDPSKVVNDTCVICIEEFTENDMVKRLACRHAYHARCIDVWLMQSDKCPLCNKDALKKQKRFYDGCCCCLYPNADGFGFDSVEMQEGGVISNYTYQNALIQGTDANANFAAHADNYARGYNAPNYDAAGGGNFDERVMEIEPEVGIGINQEEYGSSGSEVSDVDPDEALMQILPQSHPHHLEE